MNPRCPFCNKEQIKKPKKEWKYNNDLVNVGSYTCECGKNFKYYKSRKVSWTIPKKK